MSDTSHRPRRGDQVMILPSDGTFNMVPATVRRVYKTGAVSVMILPGVAGTEGMRISPKTRMVHYIVNSGDFELFKRGL